MRIGQDRSLVSDLIVASRARMEVESLIMVITLTKIFRLSEASKFASSNFQVISLSFISVGSSSR